jgi:hypothetical protein
MLRSESKPSFFSGDAGQIRLRLATTSNNRRDRSSSRPGRRIVPVELLQVYHWNSIRQALKLHCFVARARDSLALESRPLPWSDRTTRPNRSLSLARLSGWRKGQSFTITSWILLANRRASYSTRGGPGRGTFKKSLSGRVRPKKALREQKTWLFDAPTASIV